MTAPASKTEGLVPLMLALSATTGLIDAVSVIGLGKVFTANMTGNIAFLGFAAAGTPGFYFAPMLTALGLFLVGAAIGGRSARMHQDRPLARWLLVSATIEAILLIAAAGFAIGYDIASLSPRPNLYAIIGLTALAMGYRNATVRSLKVPDLTTTVLTLTLTGLAADSAAGAGGNANWGRRILAVVMIFAGAAVGAFLLLHWGLAIPLLVAAAIIFVSSALCAVRVK
ncbi:YoaK family protein [Sphingomonas crocodyli]|uniref:DUF1275 domain-containing protein n=1 Tax=Sphingomonas crocodyli TaxID=1979270 RepID=A0A437M0S4_9SPHN|nr:YoaK family protein [Sphingomonas crocodyli]RVT91193.1 DUF1275 domain-containing protein [Sphingomonas crocodyli]